MGEIERGVESGEDVGDSSLRRFRVSARGAMRARLVDIGDVGLIGTGMREGKIGGGRGVGVDGRDGSL